MTKPPGAIRVAFALVSTKVKVRMFRELWDAIVVEDSPYDPGNGTIRMDG